MVILERDQLHYFCGAALSGGIASRQGNASRLCMIPGLRYQKTK
jgi:hypothetical protein